MTDGIDQQLGIDMANPIDRLARQLVDDTFGIVDKLVVIRKQRGLSRADVAKEFGWPVKAVELFETVSSDPKLSTIRRYALAVGASIHTEVRPADG